MVQYDDYEQIAGEYFIVECCLESNCYSNKNDVLSLVADLPGLIAESHKNRGLGITFLKHAERCAALLIVLDMSSDEPWSDLELLQYELDQFNDELMAKPLIVIANKMDLPEAEVNSLIILNSIE